VQGLLLVANLNQPSVLHGLRDTEPQEIFGGHDLELLESRDFICHLTVGLAVYGFLWVVF